MIISTSWLSRVIDVGAFNVYDEDTGHGYNVYNQSDEQHLMVAQCHGVKVKCIVELGNNSPLELCVPGT